MIRYLELVYALALLSAISWCLADSVMIPVLVPIILVFVGIGFLYCKRLKNASFVARAFCWVSYNLLVPRNERNNTVWGLIFVVIGVLSVFLFPKARKESILGDPSVHDTEAWWYKDPMLWAIILLLVLIGIYRSQSRPK
jgi:hypothetical protein